MGQFVIAAFKPKAGKENELRAVLRDHMPTLRGEGLITDRPAYLMKAPDGCYIEVFEWKSAEAVAAAHSNPTVAKLWERFEACSDYLPTGQAAGFDQCFPNFEPVDL